MASEYFSSLQYIWLNIVFFVFSLFLFAVCLYACLFVRWVYKRRLRQKTDEMIDAYKDEENKRREMELSLKRQELEFPDKKKKSSSKPRKIHIVTKPCKHVTRNVTNELIVRQVNEGASDEVRVSPTGPVAPPPPPPQQLQPQILNPQNCQHFHGGPGQPQYVLVPVEVFNNTQRVRRSSGFPDPSSPQETLVEDVSTQTSPGLFKNDGDVEQKSSEDWLAGFDGKNGERIDVDEEFDEQESEKYMRRRREFEDRKAQERRRDIDLDETRVSMESDAPPSPPKNPEDVTSSGSSTATSSSSSGTFTDAKTSLAPPSTDSPATASGPTEPSTAPSSAPSAPAEPKDSEAKPRQKRSSPKRSPPKDKAPVAKKSSKESDVYEILDPKKTPSFTGPPKKESPKKQEAKNPDDVPKPKPEDKKDLEKNGDKSFVPSQYYGQPGENTSALPSNDYPRKSTSPVGRASIFPYFIDPKAPSASVSTSRASSKLTEPNELIATDSSMALYRQKRKKMPSDSAKIYTGTPKESKSPK